MEIETAHRFDFIVNAARNKFLLLAEGPFGVAGVDALESAFAADSRVAFKNITIPDSSWAPAAKEVQARGTLLPILAVLAPLVLDRDWGYVFKE